MNVSFLETFYWLGTLKSVKDTAARMRIAQPVVSMRMAALQNPWVSNSTGRWAGRSS